MNLGSLSPPPGEVNVKESEGISIPVGILFNENDDAKDSATIDIPNRFIPVTDISDVPAGISSVPTTDIGRFITSVFEVKDVETLVISADF